jgi:hypothetical protein
MWRIHEADEVTDGPERFTAESAESAEADEIMGFSDPDPTPSRPSVSALSALSVVKSSSSPAYKESRMITIQ